MADSSQTAATPLRADALAIFGAGVDAVRAPSLVARALDIRGSLLEIAGHRFDLDQFERLVVVGAGKASGYLAAAVVERLGAELCRRLRVAGWINVPDGAGLEVPGLTIHESRPAGENFPTERVVEGTRQIVGLVRELGPRDLCLCLISGGGSALLCLPAEGISLQEKTAISRWMSRHRATIQQMNTVRRELSQVKGGRLARLCRGQMVGLILSDILGDPIDLIASGPTVAVASNPRRALAVLDELGGSRTSLPASVLDHLERAAEGAAAAEKEAARTTVQNFIIGNIETAVAAAVERARELGYRVVREIQQRSDETAEQAGRHLAEWIARHRGQPAAGKFCLISGGEPVVQVGSQPGRGGRNQHLVLAAAMALAERGEIGDSPDFEFCLLSGGTDGEDGTTPVAGALFDRALWRESQRQRIEMSRYLNAYDAFSFFNPLGGTVDIGPTQTNVGDLRVALVQRSRETPSA